MEERVWTRWGTLSSRRLILLRLHRRPLRMRRHYILVRPPTEWLGYQMGYILGIMRIIRCKISTSSITSSINIIIWGWRICLIWG
jgi:hypothetical protein